jgi:hypothetical protein
MTPHKGLKRGLLGSAIVIALILVAFLVVSIASYDGHCVSFEPPKRPCSLIAYLYPSFILFVFYTAIGRPFLFLSVLLVVLILPLVGFLVDKRR